MNDTFTKNEIKQLIKDFKHDFFPAEETETFYQDVLNYALSMAKDLVEGKEMIVKVFTNPKTRMILTTTTTLVMNTTEEARFITGDAFCQILISLNDLA